MLDRETLALSAIDVASLAGLYFLFDGEELVYVGQSNNAYRRISEHRKYGRVFQRFAFLAVPDPAERDRLEAAYIQKFSPKYNGAMPPNETALAKHRLRNREWRQRYPGSDLSTARVRAYRQRQRATA